jgi:superfamily II DNA/RNA helicase
VGGTNVNTDVRNLSKGKGQPTVVVATPGRLLDHLRNTSIHGKPFPSLLQQVQVLVLDEADQLLEVRAPPHPATPMQHM